MTTQSPLKFRNPHLIYWGVSLAAMVVVPLILHAAIPRDDERTQRLRRLEGLSKTERARIEYNYESYDRLAAAEKQRLQTMYAELTADQAGGGDLTKVLDQYIHWLETLPPGQRDDLRREVDPGKRIRMIERIRGEQIRQRSSGEERRWGGFSGFGDRQPPMTAEDLDAVMNVIAGRLSMSESERREFDTADRLDQYRAVLEKIIRGETGRPPGPPVWLDDSLMTEIRVVVADERLRQRLNDAAPVEARIVLMRSLVGGLLMESARQMEQFATEGRAELGTFFAELDGARRDEVMEGPQNVSRRLLVEMYGREHPESKAGQLIQFRDAALKLFDRNRPRPVRRPFGATDRPGDGPREGGRGEDRPRPNDLRGGGRPRGDRLPGDRPGPPPPQRRPDGDRTE